MSFSYYLKIKRHLTVRKDFPPEIICSRILLHWCRLEKCYTNDVDSTEKHFRWGCSPAETPPLHRQFWGGSWMVGPDPGQWGHCAENTSVHRSRVASAPAPGLTGSLSRVFSTHRPGRSRENGLQGCTARGSLSCCSEGLGPGGQGRPGRPLAPAPQPLPHCLRPDATPVTRVHTRGGSDVGRLSAARLVVGGFPGSGRGQGRTKRCFRSACIRS